GTPDAGTPAATGTAAGPVPPATTAEIRQWLSHEVARRVKVRPGTLDLRQPVASYGLGSVDMVGIAGDLERRLGRELPATLVWEYPTIEALATFLGSSPAAREVPADPSPAAPRPRPGDDRAEPIAIIGIGCRFPGGADDPQSFWQLLCEGRDAVTEVPADRWTAADFLDDDPAVPGKTVTRWGGFVDTVDAFDPPFFGISPREAARMDPQQRLLAEVAWEALEDAGVAAERLAGSPTGVFVGIATSDYAHLQLQDFTRIDAFTGTGNAFSIAANRLSYLLDLRGPSMAVDTACSSSLVTVYQACQSLAQGDCSVALAGGVNLILSPALSINFSKAGAMAPDGRCKAFDSRADGYVRAEGAGIVVLKPLAAALSDGDRIYATILGGAVNQDGRTNGLMAPNPHAQEAVLRAAYTRAGIAPDLVRYVEAHGTGTLLGDPIEAKALGAVVGAGRDRSEPCQIGSVKSNLGHLEAAAGIAGLIKVALMVRNRMIPPSLHYQRPNPHIPFPELALAVADSLRPWPESAEPALAGVSSFGFGGTNAHLVVREAPQPAEPGDDAALAHVLTISAHSDQALRDLVARYEARLARPDSDLTPASLCRAAAVRRVHHDHRLACVGGSLGELREGLGAFAREQESPGLSPGGRRIARHPTVTFVFSGQGPRWWPLGSELLDAEPVFREVIERADTVLRRHVDWSLLEQLTADPDASHLADTAVGQPALCAVQIALAALWRSWGIEPAAVVGHSVGEVAAACVTGALDLEEALLVAFHRGRVIRSAVGGGRMAVVGLSSEQTRQVLDRLEPGPVWVSASNGPGSTVLSGDTAALAGVVGVLNDEGIFCRLLESVSFASHCPQMDPLLEELRQPLSDLEPRPGTIPMVSTVTAETIDGAKLDAAYWATNLRQPVLFDQAIAALVDAGSDTFVEISPHPMLGAAISERMDIQQRAGAVVHSLRRDEPGRSSMLGSLGQLYCAGFPVDWRKIYGPTGPMVSLPSYAWQRQRCWFDDEPGRRRRPAHPGHPVLETFVQAAAEPGAHYWTTRVDLEGFPYLQDHCVAGTVVLPASLMLEAALAAARAALGEPRVVIEDVRFTRMTVVDEAVDEPTLQLVLQPETAAAGSVRLFSRTGGQPGAGDWTLAAAGRYRR
ncbi:MAG: acyltransferase domain-containing protein, partial [Dactylosporangium sp.]|nr:acyltransferase domain-containing protein [Dactylosporangium sp.]NNJ63310.1 acyltransferase domain-containing protein [Dactylosporangium sp.]